MPRKTPPTSEENIASAIALAQAILASDAHETHKREFLSASIWKASEAAGKYNVPYWSYDVWHFIQPHGSLQAFHIKNNKLIHEHVHTRKSLVDEMLNDPTCVERVLREKAFACLVSQREHSLLKNTRRGF